jgi:adenosine deaminase
MLTELHRHLDVCTRPSTLWELAQKGGFAGTAQSEEEFAQRVLIREPMSDLGTVLRQFETFQRALSHPDILERVAFEAVEDCYREGIRAVELRFSPSFVAEHSGMRDWEILEGFERGIARGRTQYPDLQVGLICIASRDYGVESVAETVEFFLKNDDRFIGLDLAGDETRWPNSKFVHAFRPAVVRGARITLHSGESLGPESVWTAIEQLGARRIGHGIHSIQDPALVAYLAREGICLEICPTSNWLTRSVARLEEHPLPRLLRAGVPVCINTDDPGIFGLTLPGELRIAAEKMGLTPSELERCEKNARDHSFLLH